MNQSSYSTQSPDLSISHLPHTLCVLPSADYLQTDSEGAIVSASKNIKLLFGYGQNALLHQHISVIFPELRQIALEPPSLDPFNLLKPSTALPTPTNANKDSMHEPEYKILQAKTNTNKIMFIAVCIHKVNSNLVSYHWNLKDVTSLELFKTYATENFYRQTVSLRNHESNLPVAFFELNSFGVIDYVQFTEGCKDYIKDGFSEFMSRPIMRFICDEDLGVFCRKFSIASKQTCKFGVVCRVRWKTGDSESEEDRDSDLDEMDLDEDELDDSVDGDDQVVPCEIELVEDEAESVESICTSISKFDEDSWICVEICSLMIPRHFLGHCEHPRCNPDAVANFSIDEMCSLYEQLQKDDSDEEVLVCAVRFLAEDDYEQREFFEQEFTVENHCQMEVKVEDEVHCRTQNEWKVHLVRNTFKWLVSVVLSGHDYIQEYLAYVHQNIQSKLQNTPTLPTIEDSGITVPLINSPDVNLTAPNSLISQSTQKPGISGILFGLVRALISGILKGA